MRAFPLVSLSGVALPLLLLILVVVSSYGGVLVLGQTATTGSTTAGSSATITTGTFTTGGGVATTVAAATTGSTTTGATTGGTTGGGATCAASSSASSSSVARAQCAAVDLSGRLSDFKANGMRAAQTDAVFHSASNWKAASANQAGTLVGEFAARVGALVSRRERAVRSIVEHVEDEWEAQSEGEEPDCTYYTWDGPSYAPGLYENSTVHKSVVNKDWHMYRLAKGVEEDDLLPQRHICAASRLNAAMIKNQQEDPLAKWQYFGSVEGTFAFYPSRKCTGDCRRYDPRRRPWFSSASSGPKDVLLVLDTSGSMAGNRLSTMKEAALAVIDLLNDDDYVGLVEFNSAASNPTCFDGLTRATPLSKSELVQRIEGLVASGATNYENGLNMAFDMIETARSKGATTGCQTSLIFLTDGERTDGEESYKTVANRLSDDVELTVFAFALGDDARSASGELKRLACDNNGIYSELGDSESDDLLAQMSAFFQLYAQGIEQDKVTWGAPIFDFSGLGMVLTGALPAYGKRPDNPNTIGEDGTMFLGVAGIDVSGDEIATLAQPFQRGLSYAFIVNNYGEVLFHPRLGSQSNVQNVPLVKDISELESASPEFMQIRAAMISGQPGVSGKISVTRYQARGNSGFNEITEFTTYAWAPAGPFIVCYALSDSDLDKPLVDTVGAGPAAESFYLNFGSAAYPPEVLAKLTYAASPSDPQHPSVGVTRDASGFFIPDHSWAEPAEFLQGLRDSSTTQLRSIHAYANDNATHPASNPGWDNSNFEVHNAVQLMSALDSSWIGADSIDSSLLWLYIAMTDSGVLREYPGSEAWYNRNYDPTLRPWFSLALANPQGAISTPYVDAAGAGTVVTVLRTVRKSASPDSPIAAVQGGDFLYDTFEDAAILAGCDPNCGSFGGPCCILVDSSGFLLTFKSFRSSFSASDEDSFLGKRYPALAQDLVLRGVLVPQTVTDFGKDQVCTTHHLNFTGKTLPFIGGAVKACCCPDLADYAIAEVLGTGAGPGRSAVYVIAANSWSDAGCVSPPTTVLNTCIPRVDASTDPCEFSPLARESPPCPDFDISEELLEQLRGDHRCGLWWWEILLIVFFSSLVFLCCVGVCIYFGYKRWKERNENTREYPRALSSNSRDHEMAQVKKAGRSAGARTTRSASSSRKGQPAARKRAASTSSSSSSSSSYTVSTTVTSTPDETPSESSSSGPESTSTTSSESSSESSSKDGAGNCAGCNRPNSLALFAPCGHSGYCKPCATRKVGKPCPNCDATIENVVTPF